MLLTLRSVLDADTTVPIRIGVNKGPVFAGDIGPGYRRTYTVMGDAVNLAARVMSMAVPGQILATGGPGCVVRRVQHRGARAVHGEGQEGPGHAFMVGHSTGSKPETVSREFPLVGRDAEMDASAGLLSRGARLGDRAGRERGDGQDEAAERVPGRGARPPQPGVGVRALRILGRLPADPTPPVAAWVPARTCPGSRIAFGRTWPQRAPELLPWLPLLAIVADAEVPMTPEVRDLGRTSARPSSRR